jgi:hypothetical protein
VAAVTPSRLVLAAVILVLTGAGCGGQTRADPRSHVAAYLTQVNRTERALGRPLSDVSHVAARLAAPAHSGSGVRTSAADVSLLRGDLGQIRALGYRLAAIRAPSAAARLRTMLVTLVARQASLTRQTAELATFLPRFNEALTPLAAASRRLERALLVNQAYGAAAVQAVYAEKAAALRRFHAKLQDVLARLARLHPPPVSASNYRVQKVSLKGMSVSASRLATALETGDPTAVAPLLAAFDRAAAIPQSKRVFRAQVAAAKNYDREVAGLRVLAAQAVDERLRLQQTLR